ncbi:hypothetical protein SAMN04487939_106223 [Lysobacter sp. yr284]|uniref:hypothetical protein n=1 Tax=Lysobacter sp. yr284 TaxID=1761791 RepID=UPI000894756A|nr:hypothetical protein [Lysobacter sp. yr284]SDY81431.1 hypothetical protein SAMN04487939_106223 [Lysobacter sp. yr284]
MSTEPSSPPRAASARRRLLLAAGIAAALAAVVAAYFAGRAGAGGGAARPDSHVRIAAGEPGADAAATAAPLPTPIKGGILPAPGAPLKDHFAQLQARANAGDAGAATRLVRDLDRCARLRSTQWRNAGATEDLTRRSTEGMSAAQLRTYQTLLEAMELRQQAQRQDQAACAGVDEAMLASLVPNIAQAARLGDEQARACYLERGPLYDARSLIRHPDGLRAYRGTAAALVEAGLSAGDWRVVDLLQQAYEPGSKSLLAGLLGADPLQHYRYLKLYRLGAESHRADQLDRQLAAVATGLSPAQLAEGDAWAQNTLDAGFKGRSTDGTPPGWEACDF